MTKKEEAKNCWEFWACLKEIREKCPAYLTNSGRECWAVAENYCPRIKRKFKHCWDCPWFKKLNPGFR
jgi:hypothetical protein